jgi:hypothetical protein
MFSSYGGKRCGFVAYISQALTIFVIIEVTGNDNKQPLERALRKIEWTTEGFLVEILKRTR